MAATYAHATAPLRRLADRYVIEAMLAIANGRPVPDEVTAAFTTLPAAMAKGEQRANSVDRAVIDLAEAVLLSERVGTPSTPSSLTKINVARSSRWSSQP
jgi:exoribonuclease R